MKKLLALLLVLVMAIPTLALGEKVNLEFIQWWASEAGGENLQVIVDEYEALNPDVNVELITLPFGETRNQTVTNFMTGTSADIVGMNPPWVREFYDLGILAPLEEMIAADENYDTTLYPAYEQIDGHTYSVPYTQMGFFLFYNIDMFEAAGLAAPTNWAELKDAAIKLTNAEENKYGMSLVLSESAAANGSILSLYPMLYAANGSTLKDGKFVANSDEMVAALTLIDDLQKAGALLPGTTSKTEFQVVEEFAQGNIAMMIEHDGHIIITQNRINETKNGMRFGIIPIPTIDGEGTPSLRHHGWDIAIASTCEHPQEAWDFISYISSKEVLDRAGEYFGKVPAIKGSAPASLTDAYPQYTDAIGYMATNPMIEELMLMPSSSTCWTELTKAGSAVIQGTKTPEEALADCQKAWDKELGQ